MRLGKCHFFTKEIQYLGHVLSTTGMKPLPSKTEAIKPKNIKQVWAFLGFVGYYQKFIKNFAQITKLLKTLMCHDTKFNWMSYHQAVFISLKGTLIQLPIQHYPDPLKQYIVYTYASDDACGAQLSQEPVTPVMCLSHTFTDIQKK